MRGILLALALAGAACGRSPGPPADPGTADPAAPPADAADIGVADVADVADAAGGNPEGCVESFDPGRDYFPDKVSFRHAERLSVAYFGHYKVVTLEEPWAGAGHALDYLLLLCGTPRPAGHDGAEVIGIPTPSVLTTSTTELPHIVGLGLVDRLRGHDELDYVSSPEIRRLIDAGELVEIGSGPALNVELVIEADVGLLLADTLGEGEISPLGTLRRAGVPVALAPSFLETSPLGRAEWIQHTALFFNREKRAADLFRRVEARYTDLAAAVRRALEDGRRRPTVLTGGPIGDTWWVPGGRSYLALLIADAGGEYLWADDPTSGSLPRDLEVVYERALDADVWLQPGGWGTLAEILAVDRRLGDFGAFRGRRVWNYDARTNARGGNDYWETGSARPDLVLADLVRIFHPDLVPEHELVFHRKLD